MNEIMRLLEECYTAFYLGNDEKGWNCFSELTVALQDELFSSQVDDVHKEKLMVFVSVFEEIERFKQENNYTLIADYIRNTYNNFAEIKESIG